MSGHSKWHNIKVKKTAQDAKRGKVYTKHAKMIEMAARAGGDPVSNASLRAAIENAKAENVPNENIQRAIKKGTGELKGEAMQEVIYEAYGPNGTAFIITCLTDNTNRTLPNIKMILSKNGGRFAESGSVMWTFELKGEVIASNITMNDDLELALIEAGAEDVESAEGSVRIVTDKTSWTKVRDALREKGGVIESAGLAYLPKDKLSVDEETAQKVSRLIDALEEDEDVNEVYTNTAF